MPDEPPNSIMNLLRLPLVCSALWLAIPISAQTGSKATDQMSLQITQTDMLSFPLQLSNGLVMTGDATVAVHVDPDGRLTDYLVTGYSRREFADAAVASLKAARFDPPRVNGTPWSAVQEVRFDFSRTGVVISVSGSDFIMSQFDEITKGKFAYCSRSPRELDRTLTLVQLVSPVHPSLAPGEQKHVVVVNFYIDEEGRVRMPSVSRADVGTSCAASALDALKQWRFEPPLFRGRPTLVSARQVFNFVART
jgi:TonB family protein